MPGKKRTTLSTAQQFDHIIIGGGTAGAIVAARLAQAGRRIALFEAGPSDEETPRVLELRAWQALLESDLDFDYRIAPQARGNGRIRHARGKVLGGCSSHNSCIAFDAPDEDLDAWAAAGAAGWTADEVRPFFARVREEVHVEPPGSDNAFGRDFIAAAQAYGLPAGALIVDGVLRRGVNWTDLNKRGNLRQSSSVAYLHPLRQWDDRLTIYTGQYIPRLLVEQGRVTGVESADGPLRCAGDVILSCGAFDSPTLLMRSGIGPAEHLRGLGLDVVRDIPGVGEHLLDHPEGVITWETTRPLPPETANYWEIVLFEMTRAGLASPDLMFHLGYQVFDMHTAPSGYPTAAHGFSLTPNVTRARSQGVVRLRSADPVVPPFIDFRYFTDPDGHDERVMTTGLKIAREIVRQAPLEPWIKWELAPGPDVTDDEALSDYVRATANTVYHPAGTCKMGAAADPLAVVDGELRVHGLAGLRIADASVFPSMIAVNPCLTVMMIGERCAEFVLK